jgi:hypothetical protein
MDIFDSLKRKSFDSLEKKNFDCLEKENFDSFCDTVNVLGDTQNGEL